MQIGADIAKGMLKSPTHRGQSAALGRSLRVSIGGRNIKGEFEWGCMIDCLTNENMFNVVNTYLKINLQRKVLYLRS